MRKPAFSPAAAGLQNKTDSFPSNMKLSLTNKGEIHLHKMSIASPAPCQRHPCLQFSQCSCAIHTLSYPCFIAGEMEAQRPESSFQVHITREKGSQKYKVPAFPPYTSSLGGVCLLSAETQCVRDFRSSIPMSLFYRHEHTEAQRAGGPVQSHLDNQRQSKGGNRRHSQSTEINDMLGEAGQHYYGNLEKR